MTRAERVMALLLTVVGLVVAASLLMVSMPLPAVRGAAPSEAKPAQEARPPSRVPPHPQGVVGVDQTWGPGLITLYGDLLVGPGATLTILPGTTVQMDSSDAANLGVDPKRIEMIVRGRLVANGPVTFTAMGSAASCGAWYGIRYLPGSDGYLQGVLVERGVHGVELNSTQRITVDGCTLRFNCHRPPSGDAWGAGLTILAGTHHVLDTEIYGNALLAVGLQGRAIGAGVWLAAGSTVLERCRVYDNVAQSTGYDGLGGGLALWGGGQPTVRACEIHHNRVTSANRALGGGVHIDNADAIIEARTSIHDNVIISSAGPVFGGGIAIGALERVATPVIRHSRVTGNSCSTASAAGCFGGGIGFVLSSPAGGQTKTVISNNLIADNSNNGQTAHGGAIGMEAGTSADQFDGNIIRSNLAQASGGRACGGGICLVGANGVRVSNNLLFGNRASAPQGSRADGGALYANGANSYLSNNTLVYNTARDGGGVYLASGALHNTILANNSATADGGGVAWYGGGAGFNDLWNNTPNNYASAGWPRPGSDVVADPLFVASGSVADFYHLQWGSPSIDAGSATAPGANPWDVDHQPRPQGPGWDIGFDEVLGFKVAKTAGAAAVNVGSPLRYSIEISNLPDAPPRTNALIWDPLPKNARASGEPRCTSPTCGMSAEAVWWRGNVPAGTQISLVYTVTVDYGPQITNTTHYALDTVSGWSDPVTVTVNNPMLAVSKATAKLPVAGIPFTYTLAVTNSSPFVPASGVIVTDAVPLAGHWVSGGHYQDGLVSLALPDIPPEGHARASWMVSTCQSSLINDRYRVVTSTARIGSDWGRPLMVELRSPKLVPAFFSSNHKVDAGEVVTFTDQSTFEGRPLAAWGWDFGDGAQGSGAEVTHIYDAVATYSVTLTITDGCGYHASLYVPDALEVSPPPFCREVIAVDLTQVTTAPLYTGEKIELRADISPDDAQKRYSFRLIVDGTLGFRLTSGKDPLTFHHTFSTPGTHTIEIAVWNCRMLEAHALHDALEVWVAPGSWVHLPMILKDYGERRK